MLSTEAQSQLSADDLPPLFSDVTRIAHARVWMTPPNKLLRIQIQLHQSRDGLTQTARKEPESDETSSWKSGGQPLCTLVITEKVHNPVNGVQISLCFFLLSPTDEQNHCFSGVLCRAHQKQKAEASCQFPHLQRRSAKAPVKKGNHPSPHPS